MGKALLALVVLTGVLCFCGQASADQVAIGTLSYDPLFGSVNAFDVANLTGASSLEPAFPVLTSLTFNNLDLTVVNFDGSTSSFAEGSATEGFTFFADALQVSPLDPLSATFSGTFAPTLVTLSDGSVVTLDGAFLAILNPSNGVSLTADQDSVIVYASTVQTSVPEPSSLYLAASGALFLLLWTCRRKMSASP